MEKKAGCCFGAIVNENGMIIRSWGWRTSKVCPLKFDLQKGEEIVELSEDEHSQFNDYLHKHRFDKKKHCIVCRETGHEIKLKKKKPPPEPTPPEAA